MPPRRGDEIGPTGARKAALDAYLAELEELLTRVFGPDPAAGIQPPADVVE